VTRVRRLLLLLLLGARPVLAHSVTNELALGLGADTPDHPHGTQVADQLTFRFDLNDDWTLKIGGAYTYDPASAPATGATFGTSSAQVVNALAGVDWDFTPRINLYLDAFVSPRSSQSFDSVVTVPIGPVVIPVDSLLDNATSSLGMTAGATFTIGGAEFLDSVVGGTLLDVSAGWTLLSTQQRVGAFVDRTGKPVSRSTIEAYCRAVPRAAGCRLLAPYLRGGEDTLNQFSLGAGLLQPVGGSTQLGLAGSLYLYDKDPTTAAFFTFRAAQAATGSLGAGFPLLPPSWSVSPSLQQDVGSWSFVPWYEFIGYASDLGQAHVVGLRVSLRVDANWTLWVSGTAQWDLLAASVDERSGRVAVAASTMTSGRVALGVRARF